MAKAENAPNADIHLGITARRMRLLLLLAPLLLAGCVSTASRQAEAAGDLVRKANEERADAMAEANMRCPESSDMELTQGKDGRSAADWRCRAIEPKT